MMTTLNDMKTEITSIIKRSDLAGPIGDAINHAIRDLQTEQWYFNKTMEASFDLVADQVYYDVDDDTSIPLMNQFDAIHVRISNTDVPMKRILEINLFEQLTDGNSNSGQPTNFVYYDRKIGFYPAPDQAYNVRLFGGYDAPAPADGTTEGNIWMNEGYDAVMYRALEWLNRFHIRDFNLAGHMGAELDKKKDQLYTRTARVARTGRVIPTQF